MKIKILQQAVLTILLAAASATLGACNTVGGAGMDLESAGEAVQDAADDAQR